MPSLTIENYVKAIYQICQRDVDAPAATGEIAEALEVSPGSVTSMMKTLAESGLATYVPYEGVRLTDAGSKLALRVLRRHRLIELFLVHTLKLTWDEVHEEAENMEHAVSDHLIDRIDEFLGRPATDPHGDPIPQADGTIANPQHRSLNHCQPGTAFTLVRVLDQTPEFLRHLSSNGLELGAGGVLVERHDAAETIAVEVGGTAKTLSQAAAKKLLVTTT